MTPAQPTALVEVTQADIEAAAEYVSITFGRRYATSVRKEGRWPDLVEAFARHRLAALEEAARVAEEHFRDHGRLFRTMRSNNYEIAGKRIATAIRKAKDLSHE